MRKFETFFQLGPCLEEARAENILSQSPLLHHEPLESEQLHRHVGVELVQVSQSPVDRVLLPDGRLHELLKDLLLAQVVQVLDPGALAHREEGVQNVARLLDVLHVVERHFERLEQRLIELVDLGSALIMVLLFHFMAYCIYSMKI